MIETPGAKIRENFRKSNRPTPTWPSSPLSAPPPAAPPPSSGSSMYPLAIPLQIAWSRKWHVCTCIHREYPGQLWGYIRLSHQTSFNVPIATRNILLLCCFLYKLDNGKENFSSSFDRDLYQDQPWFSSFIQDASTLAIVGHHSSVKCRIN